MRFHRPIRIATTAFAATALAGTVIVQSATPASAHERHDRGVLFVSTTGRAAKSGTSCNAAKYSQIQSAVNAASAGATVVVCHGVYTEDVIVSTPLTLQGDDAAIQGTVHANGWCDQLGATGPGSAPCLAGLTIKSSHVTITGMTVTGALGEGILATGSLAGGSITDVTIRGNHVVGNDTGGIPPNPISPYPQCAPTGQVPGDCGEGIHLMGVTDSTVSDNYVSKNEGGILLTDEFGPTHNNMIEENTVTANAYDCGITVPGHNPFALDSQGNPQPKIAGVYDNVIRDNRVTNNGLLGEGAGVLFANAGPGTASYNNLVEDNYLAGNELSGVTMHAHTLPPGTFEDLNGNRIIDNRIGANNLGSAVAGRGDGLDGPPAQDFSPTGILVFSGTLPVHVTIKDNVISHDTYGVWLGINGNVHAHIDDNSFHHVATPVFVYS
jgi:parallel beta-helix repeat protein